jgi:hypothetical protein
MSERVKVENMTTAPIMVPGGTVIEPGKPVRRARGREVDELIGTGAFRVVDDGGDGDDPMDDLRGEQLNEALRARGLSVSGTVDEKRERLREAPPAETEPGDGRQEG